MGRKGRERDVKKERSKGRRGMKGKGRKGNICSVIW